MEERIYRRFELIDREKEQALCELIKTKCLSPEELLLILSTIRINPLFKNID